MFADACAIVSIKAGDDGAVGFRAAPTERSEPLGRRA